MRVHLLNYREVEGLREGREPDCANHGHLSLAEALKLERQELLTFVQGSKYAVRQRAGQLVVVAGRNAVGERTGLVQMQRR